MRIKLGVALSLLWPSCAWAASVADMRKEFTAAGREKRLELLDALSHAPPEGPDDVKALFELFQAYPFPEVREAALQSLRGLKPGAASLEHAFLPYFDDARPEAQIFAVHGALAQRDEKALVFLHELAHRRFEAKSPEELPAGPQRDRWQAQYDALWALAQWEGKASLERLRQRARQAPTVARILASFLWKDALPDIRAWAASSAADDKERVREALAAPVECGLLREARAEMLAIAQDPSADTELRRQLSLRAGLCSTEAARVREDPARIDWVAIPGGTFTMGLGCENGGPCRPAHPVSVKAFELARTPVTNRQYGLCVSAGACAPARDYGAKLRGAEQPVVGVTWEQAAAFSRWAGGRLPSEAEWEYAARSAGKEDLYPWGKSGLSCRRAVQFDRRLGGAGCGTGATWPVCSKPRGNTEQGLCDMLGNVFQWVQDGFHPDYAGAPDDGTAWEGGAAAPDLGHRKGLPDPMPRTRAAPDKVYRGMPWDDSRNHFSAIKRGGDDRGAEYDFLGFRPARDR